MRNFTRGLLVPLVLIAGLIAAPASFVSADVAPGALPAESPALDDGVNADSRIGVIAAAGCGFFTRWTILTGGTQVGIIVGAVACCLLALVDTLAPDTPHPR